jgi:hypothetical protein
MMFGKIVKEGELIYWIFNIFISVYWELNGWTHLENLVILQRKILECEVLPLVIMKSFIIWDVTSYNLMKVNQHFQAQNRHEADSKQSSACSLPFNPETGGDMFFQNVCWLSMDCTTSDPKWQNPLSMETFFTRSKRLNSLAFVTMCIS